MKKYFYIMTVVFTTLSFPVISQAQTTYEEVVYLKNGNIIHGTIIEQVPNQSIKIQTKDGNVFVYKMDEVEKMTKEQVKNSYNSGTSFTNNDIKQFGYTNITELNFALRTGTASDDNSYGIQTINGYQFNPLFYLGLGVGVDKYKNTTFVPIFVDFRINFIPSSVTPFFETAIGYSLTSSSNGTLAFSSIGNGYYNSTNFSNKGGLMLNPAFGVKFFVSPKTALNVSFGYRYQENSADFTYSSYYGYYKGTTKINEGLINLKLGATF